MIPRLYGSAVLTLLIFSLQTPVYAATCSCAGVPLLTSIDTSAIEKGQLFISYTAENHQINDLVSGSVLGDLRPRDSWRASKDFREQIITTLSERVLKEALNRNGVSIP